MNFVYPNFLWALGLIAIPIIIHLFNFRRYKTVYFSKVDLLNEAIEDSKSGNKLKHILVLLSRILAIIALVLAFAQPYLSSKKQQNTKSISSIYIDNSFSMQALGQDGDLLNEVKNNAIDLVNSFEENEKINLLTSELLSKDQRFYTKSDIIERIKQIDLSPASTALQNATNLQIDLLKKNGDDENKRLFIFSDFQKSSTEIGAIPDTNIQPFIYQASAEVNGNIFIDSVWFESPVQNLNMPIELFFRIKNLSNTTLENLVTTLTINGKEKGVKSLKISAKSFSDESVSFSLNTAGIKTGKLNIKTNQLFFDDQFFFTFDIKNQTNILIVNGNSSKDRSLEQLYAVNSFYNTSSVDIGQLKQDDFNDKSFIIFNGINKLTSGSVNLLNSALKQGASIVLIPGNDIDLISWNSFLSSHNQPNFSPQKSSTSSLKYFNDSDPLFKGVFDGKPSNYIKTKIKRFYPFQTNRTQNFITLFGINNNEPFLIYTNTKQSGKIVLQAASLSENFGDFKKQALFAATYLRLAETSAYQKSLFYTIGQPESYRLKTVIDEKQPIHLKNDDYKTDIIPSYSATDNNQSVLFDKLDGSLNQAGFYELTNLKGFSDMIAFNFDRNESQIECHTETSILNLFKENKWSLVEFLKINQKGKIELDNVKPKEYWRIFLFFALLFFMIEIALLKWWKTS
ncbi:MAG: BatA domain-containing protein [Crocinitomicaceae bacterium]